MTVQDVTHSPTPPLSQPANSARYTHQRSLRSNVAESLQGALSTAIYALALLIGVLLFLYPFYTAGLAQQGLAGGESASSPLALALVVGICLAAIIVEAQGQAMSAKLVALLGILVAINSVLRLAETAMPLPGGFTPVFMLIILSGYVFGARFGFLMGTLTLLVSALLTGGIGPWLPNQMFTAGWVGMSAGWLGRLPLGRAPDAQRQTSQLKRRPSIELGVLILFGAVWGFAYGAVMNLWFWPFQAGDPSQSWQAGLSLGQTVQRYLVFYAATSLIWDALAAAGNIALLWLFGIPTLKALRRFKSRFVFESCTR